METSYIFKEFFERTLNSNKYESRSSNKFININERENYLFNSSINGIEESDLIFLIGTNPRYEATILNSRIRNAFLKNKCEIYSFGNSGDLTYDYEIIENNTSQLKEILDGTSSIT